LTLASITSDIIDETAVRQRLGFDGAGAVLTFAGTVRNHHLGREVTEIHYHAYEGMAEKELARIESEATRRWPQVRMEIVHRIGVLEIGATSVLIAVASPHRDEGFQALRFGIEAIKESVPIWKKEIYLDGHAWLEGS